MGHRRRIRVRHRGVPLPAVAHRRRAGFDAFPLDDSWIHLHFARNLAEGHGFSYNPGVPGRGSTAPLWTLLLGGGLRGRRQPRGAGEGPRAPAAASAAAWPRGRSPPPSTGDPGLGVLAGAVTALSGPMLWGALSGMEVALAAALATGAFCRPAARALVAAALAQPRHAARPEAVLLVPLRGWRARFAPRRSSLFFAWSRIVWRPGRPSTSRRPARLCRPPPRPRSPAGSSGPAVAAARAPRRCAHRPPVAVRGRMGAMALAVNALLPPSRSPGSGSCGAVAEGVSRPRARGIARGGRSWLTRSRWRCWPRLRGPGFQDGRYSIHLLPLAVVVAVVRRLAPLAAGAGPRRQAAPRAARRPASAGSPPVPRPSPCLPPRRPRCPWRPIATAGRSRTSRPCRCSLGRWVASSTPPAARLALNDIGAIAYLSRRESSTSSGS